MRCSSFLFSLSSIKYILAASLLVYAHPTKACMIVVPGEFVLDEASDDTVAPGPPGALAVTGGRRGHGPTCMEDGGMVSTSCDDIGSMGIIFTAALDDRSPPEGASETQEGVGYILRVVSGTLPDDLVIHDIPTQAYLNDGLVTIDLVWVDGGTDAQEPYAFTLGVTAVDLAGNLSPEVTLYLSDPGYAGPEHAAACQGEETPSSEGICGIETGMSGAAVLLAVAAAFARKR